MIAAYCFPQSALPGESIAVHCSTTASRYRFEVVRQGAADSPVFQSRELRGVEHPLPDDAASRGCGWPTAAAIEIGDEWSSGFYLVRFRDADGGTAEAFFVVRAKRPGKTLLVLSTSTWAAYNDWGGPSYYTGGVASSLERPLPKGFLARPDVERFRAARAAELPAEEVAGYLGAGYSFWVVSAGWSAWERLFVEWAEGEGISLDYAVSADLEAVPGLLDPYRLYLSVGHDEYWSWKMRDAVEGFVARGGRAAFLSGNTAFWQIRWEDRFRRQVAYKMDIEGDPMFGGERQRELTTMWSDPLVGRPENHMTGVSFTRGGYARVPNAPRGTGGYEVHRPEHWVFAGTGLGRGDILGAEPAVVGYECDGCEIVERDGVLVPTGADGTPADFEILASAPAHLWTTEEAAGAGLPPSTAGELNWVALRLGGADDEANRQRFGRGRAVMGTFRRGRGEVFTTGCTDWAFGLADPQVARVTRNVLDRFLAPGP